MRVAAAVDASQPAFTLRGDPPRKPDGGYASVPAFLPVLAWFACHMARAIRPVDLRVWFAAIEQRERRCMIRGRDDFPAGYTVPELARLAGMTPKRARESLRRLAAAGLLAWSESEIALPESPDGALAGHDLAGFWEMMAQLPSKRREGGLLPIPRRMLRVLAGGARPAMVATVLGHLLFGLYADRGRIKDKGRVKASWIARVFGMGLSRIKAARAELVKDRWLIPAEHDNQRLRNRWGGFFRINLEWDRHCAAPPAPPAPPAAPDPAAGPGLAPPPPDPGPGLAPPSLDPEPLAGGFENQEPAAGGPGGAGVCMQGPGGEETSLPAPDLRDVRPEDLRDTGRLLQLHQAAAELDLVADSEHGRLQFVAAAEHARAIGTKNPPGLFVRIVRRGLWSFLTQDDEDTANERLKRHFHGFAPERRSGDRGMDRGPAPLSSDAKVADAFRAACARARGRPDPFPILRSKFPDWTRERFDRAIAELDAERSAQQLRNLAMLAEDPEGPRP